MTFDFILRIFVAALLGGAIGLEREYRDKAADSVPISSLLWGQPCL